MVLPRARECQRGALWLRDSHFFGVPAQLPKWASSASRSVFASSSVMPSSSRAG